MSSSGLVPKRAPDVGRRVVPAWGFPAIDEGGIMHGLDDSTDLAFLAGRTLLGLRIGRYQVILEFDDEADVSVESGLRVSGRIDSEIDAREGGYFKDLGALDPALGERIATAGVEGGRVRLGFEGGIVVELVEDYEPYESYQIRHGPILIVI